MAPEDSPVEKIGLIGGSFDPPHYAHLFLAQHALETLGLSCVLFVPAGTPPHKAGTRSSAEHRVRMVQIAIADNPQFRLSRVDVDRPGPHYSVDMLARIQAQYPASEIYFLMGEDMYKDLPNWRNPRALYEDGGLRFAVMPRPDAQTPLALDIHADTLPGLAQYAVLLHSPLLEISSTDIVGRLRNGQSARYLLPDAVLRYIDDHGLYRETT